MSELPEIHGFTLLSRLGQGGMGQVFLAREQALGRRIALKLISDELDTGGREGSRERFLREARAMASTSHPNLAGIHALGEHAGRVFIVMELLEGGSLADRIRERGRLDPREALEIVGQVCDGLSAAWQRGLVHRDIKPSNILFDAHGTVKVADFGLAKPLENREELKLTRTGFVLGSPHYMSPEHAEAREVDIRSDLYSLGIVLFEMLVGSPPFEGDSYFAIVAQHLAGTVPDVAAVRPGVPAGVAGLVRRLTNRDPAMRPGSPAEVRREVDRLLARLDGAPARPFRLARRLGFAAAAVLGLAIVAAGLALARARRPEPVPLVLAAPTSPTPPARRLLRPSTQPPRPQFAVGPEAAPEEVARALAALRTNAFGLEIAPAGGLIAWRVRARRSVYPILLALEEDGDLRRLVPGGLAAGEPLPDDAAVVLSSGPTEPVSAPAWTFLVATEKPLAQPVILGARPEADATFYPRRIGSSEPASPAHTYLRWLTGSLGGAAGAWDAVALNSEP